MVAPAVQAAVVVIGRNEGERLRRCLESVRDASCRYPLAERTYVDSGSTDGSARLARELGFRVIELDDPAPNAAKAREAGRRASRSPVMLFLDGDCRLDPVFLAAAMPVLKQPEVGAVFGRIREQFPGKNLFHHIMDLHWWNPAAGRAQTSAGCLLVKREALELAGAFRFDLFAGEDADLGFRIVRAGRELICLDVPMVWHDVGLERFSQYWTRFSRCGYSDAHLGEIWGDELAKPALRTRRSRRRLAGAAAALAAAASPWPWTAALLAAIVFAAAPVAAESLRAHSRGGRWYSGPLFAVHLHVSAAALAWGRILRTRDRRRAANSAFEYKRPVAARRPVGSAQAERRVA